MKNSIASLRRLAAWPGVRWAVLVGLAGITLVGIWSGLRSAGDKVLPDEEGAPPGGFELIEQADQSEARRSSYEWQAAPESAAHGGGEGREADGEGAALVSDGRGSRGEAELGEDPSGGAVPAMRNEVMAGQAAGKAHDTPFASALAGPAPASLHLVTARKARPELPAVSQLTQLLHNTSFEDGPPSPFPRSAEPDHWELSDDFRGGRSLKSCSEVEYRDGPAYALEARSGARYLANASRYNVDWGSAEQTVQVPPGTYDLWLSFWARIDDTTNVNPSWAIGELIVDGKLVASSGLSGRLVGQGTAYRNVWTAWKGQVLSQVKVRLTLIGDGAGGGNWGNVAVDDVELWSSDPAATQCQVIEIIPRVVTTPITGPTTVTIRGSNLDQGISKVRLWRRGSVPNGVNEIDLAGSNLVPASDGASLAVDFDLRLPARATVAISGDVADGDTIGIDTGAASRVYEFDTDDGVTSPNVLVDVSPARGGPAKANAKKQLIAAINRDAQAPCTASDPTTEGTHFAVLTWKTPGGDGAVTTNPNDAHESIEVTDFVASEAALYDVIVEQPGCNPRVIAGGLQVGEAVAVQERPDLKANPGFGFPQRGENGEIKFGEYANYRMFQIEGVVNAARRKGGAVEGLATADRVLKAVGSDAPPQARAAAKLMRAEALTWNRRYLSAIAALEEVVAEFGHISDSDVQDICADALAQAYAYSSLFLQDPVAGERYLEEIRSRYPDGRYQPLIEKFQAIVEARLANIVTRRDASADQ